MNNVETSTWRINDAQGFYEVTFPDFAQATRDAFLTDIDAKHDDMDKCSQLRILYNLQAVAMPTNCASSIFWELTKTQYSDKDVRVGVLVKDQNLSALFEHYFDFYKGLTSIDQLRLFTKRDDALEWLNQ